MIAFDNSLWKRRRSSVLILLIAFVVFVTAAVSLGLPSAAHAQGPPPTLIVPQPPAVFGDIYIDSNGNGVYDWPEERGIQGAALRLAGPSTPAADSASLEAYVTETDANGFFYFPELPGLGLYTLEVDLPAGYLPMETQSFLVEVGETTASKVQVGAEAGDVFLPLLGS